MSRVINVPNIVSNKLPTLFQDIMLQLLYLISKNNKKIVKRYIDVQYVSNIPHH